MSGKPINTRSVPEIETGRDRGVGEPYPSNTMYSEVTGRRVSFVSSPCMGGRTRLPLSIDIGGR